MNIVLLSGGSGKRLWPLSNDIRSKQFIPFLKDEMGNYESMLKRVYRQINEVDSNANITIATSKSQASSIKNQLEDKVSICIEPCRRDTFPAIALAAAYLRYEKGVELEENIIVCPVDPYVEKSYYEAFVKLEKLINEKTANLSLMGIEPTYPSEKYGYIIPETKTDVSRVKEFKEKPTVEIAKEYLKQGAIWNAGVFGFKLKYMIEKSHEMFEYTDYRDLYDKYETLKKISFDYAVVEKENSIQVMRYVGEWKDIGTWNMMAEVMSDFSKGNVIMDDTCVNTHVINELEIPVLCMGARELVIAASCDGILVSDKEQSGNIKAYVEKIDGQVRYAEKSWGTYQVIDVQPGSMTVRILLASGSRMTYHAHEHRDEVWTIVSGKGKTIVDGMEQDVKTGDVITISAQCKHTIIADTDMSIIEVQIGEEISQKDKTVYSLE